MTRRTVALLTIGQAPRDDVVPEIEKLLGPAIRVVQAGALDDLSLAEVATLAPGPDDDALTTRLRDGREVIVAKRAVIPRLQACLDRLAGTIDAAVVLCAGAFPRFRAACPVLEPDRILLAAAQAVYAGGRLGIVIPLEQQRAATVARFRAVAEEPAVVVASPYQGDAVLVQAAEALRRAEVSLIVMNCMGHTEAMKALVRDVTGAPVLLPGSLLARFVAEVL